METTKMIMEKAKTVIFAPLAITLGGIGPAIPPPGMAATHSGLGI